MENNTWRLEEIWNSQLRAEQYPPKVREHIWASEIGKNFYERYQKMMGVPVTNPPDDRVLRKFSAGTWFEEQIGYILERVGILQSKQEKVWIEPTSDCLAISGKIDYIAGGVIDWDKARQSVRSAKFPTFVENIGLSVIDYFQTKYPFGLEPIIYEVKSVNSQVFWAKKDYLEEAYPWHVFQDYTYLLAKKYPLGRILYISKDDLTIKEIDVHCPDEVIGNHWLNDIKTMTNYIRTKTEPPLPEPIVLNPRGKIRFQRNKQKMVVMGKYEENWEIKWSPYFTKMTGFEDSDTWITSLKPKIKQLNDERKEQLAPDVDTGEDSEEGTI